MLKKFTCTALAVSIMISGMICVSATSKADFSLENAKEYFTLMNGCSRTALKNYNDEDTVDAIVYCGLDLSSPKIMFYLSMFYIANDIDTEKITADPAYCTQIIGKSTERKSIDIFLYPCTVAATIINVRASRITPSKPTYSELLSIN